MVDGGHHKQWYLEQILVALGYDLEQVKRELWDEIPAYDDGYKWEEGIPP